MRAICFAAAIGILGVAPGVYAQGQTSASMNVSVRVLRSCNVTAPDSSIRITAQCAGAAVPQTQLAVPVTRVVGTSPVTPSAPRTDAGGLRVLTVNF